MDKSAPVFGIYGSKSPYSQWPALRLIGFFTIIIVGVYLIMKFSELIDGRPDVEDTRSRQMKVPDPKGITSIKTPISKKFLISN